MATLPCSLPLQLTRPPSEIMRLAEDLSKTWKKDRAWRPDTLADALFEIIVNHPDPTVHGIHLMPQDFLGRDDVLSFTLTVSVDFEHPSMQPGSPFFQPGEVYEPCTCVARCIFGWDLHDHGVAVIGHQHARSRHFALEFMRRAEKAVRRS